MIQNPDVIKKKKRLQLFLLYKRIETSSWIRTNSQMNYYKQKQMTNRKTFVTRIPHVQKALTN